LRHPRVEIKTVEARNAHTDAALVVARAMNDEDAVAALERIKATQEGLGYLPTGLDEERHRVMTPLWDAARA